MKNENMQPLNTITRIFIAALWIIAKIKITQEIL
jgi:hypothetical protein